jgi:hypothetical protein
MSSDSIARCAESLRFLRPEDLLFPECRMTKRPGHLKWIRAMLRITEVFRLRGIYVTREQKGFFVSFGPHNSRNAIRGQLPDTISTT